MGKSSSAKKVARAARAGGATSKGKKRNLLFPISVAAVLIVGVLIVGLARNTNTSAAQQAPRVTDHFHAAYGIYVCDKFLDPLTDKTADTLGIHTHGDGIIHIHPFGSAAAGKNATLITWGKTDGLTFAKDSFTVNGTTYANGYDCNGQPAHVALYVWNADDTASAPQVITSNVGDFRMSKDRLAIVLAMVPDGVTPPPPPSIPTLDNLSDVPGATTTTSVVGSATVTPGASPDPANTIPGAAPSTTAPANQ
jgi:hypothetical protein